MGRVASLGDLLPIALVERDGLIVTTDGRYVRLIECEQVPNTITADPTALAQIEAAFAHLCRLIPDRQSLVIYAQTDPVPMNGPRSVLPDNVVTTVPVVSTGTTVPDGPA